MGILVNWEWLLMNCGKESDCENWVLTGFMVYWALLLLVAVINGIQWKTSAYHVGFEPFVWCLVAKLKFFMEITGNLCKFVAPTEFLHCDLIVYKLIFSTWPSMCLLSSRSQTGLLVVLVGNYKRHVSQLKNSWWLIVIWCWKYHC